MGLDQLSVVHESNEGFKVFDLGFIKLGLLICYDHGFPESSRVLALNGAELIIAIVNWGEGLAGSEIVQTRAIDNGVTYMALNRVGEEEKDHFIGNSSIVDRNGQVLMRLGEQEQVASVKIVPANNDGRKNKAHPMNKRRPEFYSAITKPS